ncbi:RING-type E3 ubiquitin transferase [Melia azedarach]|uniref:RING-type E3 ubiquitin transferase n=1 Tax=Melia azedarach TaxID=155640 RepID=A0ACC1YF65_MELAZ|nr:RING-type E3 ubiquitin transferase [Melia azedarach]
MIKGHVKMNAASFVFFLLFPSPNRSNGQHFVCSSNASRSRGIWLEQSREIVHLYSPLSFSLICLSFSLLPYETNMSVNSLASISSSLSAFYHDHENPDLGLIQVLVNSINQYILEFITNVGNWNALKLRCISKLNIHKQEFFEFSEQSVLSNLYWGIDSIEAAIEAEWPEEKASRLSNSERMLQVPALLDEQEVTAGIPNSYLVSCSYFYLSVVKKLQQDELQVALHFLQALSGFPTLIGTEFAPKLCESLFPSFPMTKLQENVSESMRQMARRYKHWIMYYQVLQYKETPQLHCGYREISSPDIELEEQYYMHELSSGTESSRSIQHGQKSQTYSICAKVHPLDTREDITDGTTDEIKARREVPEIQDYYKAINHFDQVPGLPPQSARLRRNSSIKCLHDMLQESQSDRSISVYSRSTDFEEERESGAKKKIAKSLIHNERAISDDPQPETFDQKLQAYCSSSGRERAAITLLQAPQSRLQRESNEVNTSKNFSKRFLSSSGHFNLSILELREKISNNHYHAEESKIQRTTQPQKVRLSEHCNFTQMNYQGSSESKRHDLSGRKKFNEECLQGVKDSKSDLLEKIEKAISSLCFSGELRKCDKDYAVEVTTIYEMLNSKRGVKYDMLKDVILEQLLRAISTSKEEKVIKASVSMLTTIVSANESVVEDIKKKGLRLSDLASALKRNVHEAAILIYLIKPSPTEIKTLELLPTLVEVICTSKIQKGKLESLRLTPPAASLMIIEVLVTAFDYATNNMHLSALNSPQVLCGLLDVARNQNLEELISLATILVKCMQFDGQCRKYLLQFTAVAPLICLLQSNEKRAIMIALEFFHEILCIPRSSATGLLQRIHKEGSINVLHTLKLSLQYLQADYQLLGANLLFQLDALENSSGKSVFKEKAVQIILKSVASEENSSMQLLSSFILSNIGGTFSWTGEPYTVAWVVKKAGLNSCLQNMIRNFDWLDQCLQDTGIDSWSSKIAKSIIEIGKSVFYALDAGLKSKIRGVSRNSLCAIAWLGFEIAKSSNSLRHSACEILLDGVQQFLHPGLELEERLLACLCIYNYASGKGMQKVVHSSEGVRESLRRLSNVSWMAEELHKVADYYLPNMSRISCVHTQILEAGHKCSGAVTALIYYKGLLYGGYSDGSIKVWDVKNQSAVLVWDVKEHRKAVTCFSLFEPGESLLSGSADKTIRVWQMVRRKLELTEVIATKESIQKVDTYGKMIFAITQGHRMKVIDSSRTLKDICRSKGAKCMSVMQGRIYVGCMDSSIQEFATTNNLEREIKAPVKSWRLQTKPINSIVVYKDWLYSASLIVEGSNIKDWRCQSKSQISIVPGKGSSIQAMGVVEDFIYLNCSSSASSLQIWLRETRQNVGRVSAGSKITSLLTANDIILCGTETGQIKGWIPF